MLSRPELKRYFSERKFIPKKRLGQNFLIDFNIAKKIVAYAGLTKRDIVFEIGAGTGNLTVEISKIAGKVFAIEKDPILCEILEEVLKDRRNVEVICDDFLRFDLGSIYSARLRIMGNLPYYISSPILEQIVRQKRYIRDALVMLQKELAFRILAKPGGRDYSSFTCFLNYYADVEYKMVVKKEVFYPKPEVDSALLYIRLRSSPPVMVKDEDFLFKVIRTAFHQRRKMLISSLSHRANLGIDKKQIKDILDRVGIDPTKRAQELHLSDFASLTNELYKIVNK